MYAQQDSRVTRTRRCIDDTAQDSAPPRVRKAGLDRQSTFRASHRTFSTTWLYQLYMLTWRAYLEQSRNKAPFIISLTTNIVFGLVLGALYSNMRKDQKGIGDRAGVLFFVVVNLAFGQLSGVLSTFPVEKAIVQRERARRLYR